MTESDLSARKKICSRFFWNRPFRATNDRKNLEKFFFEPKGHFRSFFRNFFSIFVAKIFKLDL